MLSRRKRQFLGSRDIAKLFTPAIFKLLAGYGSFVFGFELHVKSRAFAALNEGKRVLDDSPLDSVFHLDFTFNLGERALHFLDDTDDQLFGSSVLQLHLRHDVVHLHVGKPVHAYVAAAH